MEGKPVLYKSLVIVVIVLFIGMSVVSSTGNILKDVSVYKCSQESLSCDHLAYIGDYLADCWLYEFILNDPGNLTCTCDEGSYFFFAGGTWINDGVIITSWYNTVTLGGINPETCEDYVIGGQGCNGLSMDPTTCRMFGVRGSSSGSDLYEVDHETGELEYIGDCGVTWMIGIAFDADGVLYGWSISQDCLYTIDTETGEATVVGPLGINLNYASDGDFCMEDDILYLAADGSYLYECDEDTGNCNLIGQFQGDVEVSLFVIPWDNLPPFPPRDPYPEDGAIDVPIHVKLNWIGGDPDPEDNVTYDLYFGECPPITKIASNITETSFVLPPLEEYEKYCWKIVAWDNNGAKRDGPIWTFTTGKPSPPSAPIIEGPIRGKPGIEYDYTFVSTDPDGDFVSYYIDWFSTGEGIWTGYYESGEVITLAHTWPDCGTFTISAKAKDEYGYESPWGYLDVTMPRNKAIYNLLFHWFLERFPLLERLLTLFLLL